MGMAIDRQANNSPGKKGTGKESIYFNVDSDSSSGTYNVTLNYDTGHFCSCRGMLSKIRKFGAVPTLDARQALRLPKTSQHWCKHVHAVRSAPADFRIEARKMRNEFFGINETPVDPETGQAGDPIAPPAPTGRRAAVKATMAKKAARGDKSAADRLAEIEAQREALLAEVAAEEAATEIRSVVSGLVDAHGAEAVKKALAS